MNCCKRHSQKWTAATKEENIFWEAQENSIDSRPRHLMVVSGKLHALAALLPSRIKEEDGGASQLVWRVWAR